MTHAQDQLPPSDVLERGYEAPGVSNGGLIIFFILFTLVAVIVIWGLWTLVLHYEHVSRPEEVPVSATPPISVFSQPPLQPTQSHPYLPWDDLRALHGADQAVFDQLGWKKNPDTGQPTIPDAIVRALASAYANPPTTAPAASSTLSPLQGEEGPK